jgi:hypothetical protein
VLQLRLVLGEALLGLVQLRGEGGDLGLLVFGQGFYRREMLQLHRCLLQFLFKLSLDIFILLNFPHRRVIPPRHLLTNRLHFSHHFFHRLHFILSLFHLFHQLPDPVFLHLDPSDCFLIDLQQLLHLLVDFLLHSRFLLVAFLCYLL